jgi:hypothetical protein
MLKSLQSFDLRRMLEDTKIKPSSMLLGLGGILLVAYVVVGASYVMERRQQSGIKEQIAAGGGTLSSVGDSQHAVLGLQDHLLNVKTEMNTLDNAFPEKLDSATIVSTLLQYANQSHLSIKQMSALPPTQIKTSQDQAEVYSVLKYSLVVDGGLPEMLVFLAYVEGGAAQTAAVEQMAISDVGFMKEMTLTVSFYSRSAATATAMPGGNPPPAATAAPKSSGG